MITVSKEEYDKDLQKIHQQMVDLEDEYKRQQRDLYNKLLTYVQVYRVAPAVKAQS